MTSLAVEQQTMADVERARAVHKRLMSLREAPQCRPMPRPRAVKGVGLPAEAIKWTAPVRPAPAPELEPELAAPPEADAAQEPATEPTQALAPAPEAEPETQAAGAPPEDAASEESTSLDPTPPRLTIYLIAQVTAQHFGVAIEDMLSHRRFQQYVTARQVAMYLAKKLTTRSLPFIGRRLGGRDHTTILHGTRKVPQMMAKSPALKADVLEIEAKLMERVRS